MVRNTNTGTIVAPTRKVGLRKNMAGYDKLPKVLRKAIAEGEVSWGTDDIIYVMRKKRLKAKDIIERLNRLNRENYLAAYPGIEKYLE